MVFIIARQNKKIVAGTINMVKNTHFYGRLSIEIHRHLVSHNADIGEPSLLFETYILKLATTPPLNTVFNGIFLTLNPELVEESLSIFGN